ncbi:hypothetical protein ACXYTP_01145 [Tsukamurella ocularis]|uniref:hypothetical protein n=1 Tax=Tsukamurella ocularis TaxID=1970234 RepID=UPI0039EEABC2
MTTNPLPHRDRGALSGALTGIFFVGAIVGAMRIANSPIPRPGAPAPDVRTYYSESRTAARFSAAGQYISILCLLRFIRSIADLARPGDPRDAVLRTAATATGIASAVALTASASTHAYLTTDHGHDDPGTRALARRVFVIGGPVHGVVYGLFIATLGVLGQRRGLWPRTGLWIGIGSGLAGILTPAYFRYEQAGWLIPIGRFSGYALSAVAGIRLARGGFHGAGQADVEAEITR